ncbi:hypothetical protein EV360DRAFT_88545 [Lentinula raphanica]|nr:hypothetical protein EV360DRAFT_88545 [Lentinula raphanica]
MDPVVKRFQASGSPQHSWWGFTLSVLHTIGRPLIVRPPDETRDKTFWGRNLLLLLRPFLDFILSWTLTFLNALTFLTFLNALTSLNGEPSVTVKPPTSSLLPPSLGSSDRPKFSGELIRADTSRGAAVF